MTDFEREITAFFQEDANEAVLPEGMQQRVFRRAKSRRVTKAAIVGVAAVTAVMAGSAVAGAFRSSPSIDPGGAPSPGETLPEDQRGGPEVVARGDVAGEWWRVIAYESDAGLCVYFEMANGSTGGCGTNVPESRDLSLSVGYLDGLRRSIIHGVVSDRAALLVQTIEGIESNVEIITGPERFHVNFFVSFVPLDADGVIEARDHDGIVLRKERIHVIPPLGGCSVEPRELPSGASPGHVRFERDLRVWGDGADRVALLAEIPKGLELQEFYDLPADHPRRVSIRGNDGVVIPVGEPPVSQIFFAWRDGACGYTVWLGPGLELKDAIDYASRF